MKKRGRPPLDPEERERRKQERKRRYYQQNREVILAKHKAWSLANKGRHRELQRRWAKANPDKMRAADERHRRKRGAKTRPTLESQLALCRGEDDACWVWPGPRDKLGYGKHGKRLAHRVVYLKLSGPIPPNRQLHHTCGETGCVNPAHLQVVTPAEHHRLHAD